MKTASVVLGAALFCALTGCQTKQPSVVSALSARPGESAGWRDLNDPALDRDIAAAFAASPDLRAVALKVERAGAMVENARGALRPQANLGLGYTEGRQRNIDFGPFDLPSWQSRSFLSWELDLSGKFRAARDSAIENQKAAVADLRLARLVLASQLAALRLNLYRLNSEIAIVGESLETGRQTRRFLEEQEGAGIVPETVVAEQESELEKIGREKLDLIRRRDLVVVRLRTLRGGSAPADPGGARFPKPAALSPRALDEVLAGHPLLQAAAARVRAAFQLERSARLDLLPSFRLEALASGGQRSLTDRFRVWAGQVGPSLDIPIYDPTRLARVKLREAEAGIAAAHYRRAVLEILADLDTARINLTSRQAQVAAALRETEALERVRKNSREQFESGLTSQIEFFDTERRWLAAKRQLATLRQALLTSRIDLIKATGGGRL